MALVLDIQKKTIYTDGITLDIEDNSSGWGDSIESGGNYPAREDVGLHLFGWQMNYKSERVSELTISNNDAATVALWQLTFTEDCWFQIDILAVLLWVSGSYDSGRVVSYSGKIYLSNTTTTDIPGTPGGGWDEITDHEDLLDDENEAVADAYTADVYFARDNDVFSTNFEAATMDLVDGFDTFDKNAEQRDEIFQVAKRLVFTNAMEWNVGKGDYFKADLILRKGSDI